MKLQRLYAAALAVAAAFGRHWRRRCSRRRRQPRVDKLDHCSLDDYEAKTGKKVPAFKQAPMLDADVASGELPPVEKRLPVREDVQVVVSRATSIGTLRRHDPLQRDKSELLRQHRLVGAGRAPHGPDHQLGGGISRSSRKQRRDVRRQHGRDREAPRRGMKWSDGAPLTADDVMFWYKDIGAQSELPPHAGAVHRRRQAGHRGEGRRQHRHLHLRGTQSRLRPYGARASSRASRSRRRTTSRSGTRPTIPTPRGSRRARTSGPGPRPSSRT